MNIRDIAKLAQVSPATVSIVLNNRPGVSDATRLKIQTIISEQGYAGSQRKPPAKSIQDHRNIRFIKYIKHGMLVERNDGFISSVIDAVETEARKRGYNLVMTSADHHNLSHVFDLIHQMPLDGMIVLGTELEESDLTYFNGLNVPIVIIDNYLPFNQMDTIVMNNAEITVQAVSYLHQLGHRSIGYFQSAVPISNFLQREEGFRHAMRQLELIEDPGFVFKLTPTMDGSYQDMKRLLASGRSLPTAVFADNDMIAIGAMKALKEKGIRIPQDVSVIGFDDISTGRVIDPPLTTMRVFQEEIGRWAVRRLNDKIVDSTRTVMKIQLGGEIIVRASTAARLD